jgi:tRNA modification GTPase
VFKKIYFRKKIKPKKSIIHISALTGSGIGGLLESIKKKIGLSSLSTNNTYLSTLRQKNALILCAESVCRAIDIVENQQADLTILSYETRDALNSVDALLGKTTTDEILNEVFSSFCVGK